ncbi:RAP domain-containing protein [Endozoicomonas sp. ALB091]|uniref:RAP domain-containing protein n=2 Tax=unclassified Endozoicomonas TaxID=2644528 RepID=UPI003BB5A1FF
MDRSSAGTSSKYAKSDNDYNQPNDHAASSRRGQYRHTRVKQWDNPSRAFPGHNEFYQSSDARPSQNLMFRSVNSAQDFNALIKQEVMDGLVSKSDRFGHRYDGRNHGQYASSIKKYTSAAKRPLNRAEQSQLMRLLQNFTATRSWNWRSLTTTLHSFTSAGVFTLHNPIDERVERTQAALLSTLLDAIIFHCNQKPEARNIDPQGIANLLWAMAKLGELVELNVVTSTFESLVYRISENPQLSQKAILMSLWGVMVCCARLSLVSNANKNHVLEKPMDDLFTRLKNTFLHNEEDQRTIALAASWLGRACPVVPHYQIMISKPQSDFREQLQSHIPSLKIEEEKSLNSLPPVDLLLPDHNMVIEVQGPSHYVGGDFKTRNGSTLLKIALLRKSGFGVIEIPINMLWNRDSMKRCIDQIKARVDISSQRHGSVSLKRRWADQAYVTADRGRQPSDHGYLTAEEHSDEQTGKPAKRKKTNNQ